MRRLALILSCVLVSCVLGCGATTARSTGAESPSAVWAAAVRAGSSADFAGLYALLDPPSQAVQLRGACADAAWYLVGALLGIAVDVDHELIALSDVLRRHGRDPAQAVEAVALVGGRPEDLGALADSYRRAAADVEVRWASSPATSGALYHDLMRTLGRTQRGPGGELIELEITGDYARGVAVAGANRHPIAFTRVGGRWYLHTATSVSDQLDALGEP